MGEEQLVADLNSRMASSRVMVVATVALPCSKATVAILNRAMVAILSSQCMVAAAMAEAATVSHNEGKVEDLVLEVHWHSVPEEVC